MAIKRRIVPISEIVVDEKLYPRDKPMEYRIKEYAKEMDRGSVFPPIYLANFGNKNILVDGRHRLEANKERGEKYVNCEVKDNFTSREEIFETAIRMNNKHGQRLTKKDKEVIVLKLQDMKYDIGEIYNLTGIKVQQVSKIQLGKTNSAIPKLDGAKKIFKGKKQIIVDRPKQKEEVPLLSKEDEIQSKIMGQVDDLTKIETYRDISKGRGFPYR